MKDLIGQQRFRGNSGSRADDRLTALFVRNGQVHEAWEGGDGPGRTLRRPQGRHREGWCRRRGSRTWTRTGPEPLCSALRTSMTARPTVPTVTPWSPASTATPAKSPPPWARRRWPRGPRSKPSSRSSTTTTSCPPGGCSARPSPSPGRSGRLLCIGHVPGLCTTWLLLWQPAGGGGLSQRRQSVPQLCWVSQTYAWVTGWCQY